MADTETKFETELAKFDPQVAELQKVAEIAKAITITDFSNKEQVALVRAKRIELKGMRVQITKTGKALRDDANKFNQAVLAKEKEMVGVIQPEEERLEKLEAEADRLTEIEKRKSSLPERKFRLSSIPDGIVISDEGILDMDDTAFEAYFNQRVANWNIAEKDRLDAERKAAEERKEAEEAERKAKEEAEAKERAEAQAKLDTEKKKLEDDKREFEHQKELDAAKKEAEAKAKQEAEEEAKRKEEKRLADEAKAKAEEEAKKEAEAKAEADRKAKEKAELEKKEKYQAFLKGHGWTPATQADFHLQESATEVVLYKKLGVYKK